MRILVPIDPADESSWRAALPVAVRLARHHGAQLTVMTVASDLDAILAARILAADYTRLIAELEKRLKDLLARELPADLSVETVTAQGRVYDQILRVARRQGVDLIVMASHRPAARDWLIGMNSERVVRHARCSVLVVREAALRKGARSPPLPGDCLT